MLCFKFITVDTLLGKVLLLEPSNVDFYFYFQVPGVYHFSFTGLFHALNGHGINAHIIWERGREVRHLGSSKADTNENGWPGKHSMLPHYCTLLVLVNFCPFFSEFLTWSFVYKNFWHFGKNYQWKSNLVLAFLHFKFKPLYLRN